MKIFCTAIKYYRIIDKLPKNILPLGLGKADFPSHWLTEKKGDNINHLNKYFGEATGIYWIWKNYLDKIDSKEFIGFCQYRRLWLNNLYLHKQKKNYSSLYSKLLTDDNLIFKNKETVLLQPTILKNENLMEQFEKIYGKNILRSCIDFLPTKDKDDFFKYLNGNQFSICNMFITKISVFDKYCEEMFTWINHCYEYCLKNNLLLGHNMRLPIFIIERYTSYWFEKYSKCGYLSFARLGNNLLSNNLNFFINPLKLPFTFKQFPTIHEF